MPRLTGISSVNAVCPKCKVRFGHIVENGVIRCPLCYFEQLAPVILIDNEEYYCMNCKVRFSVIPGKQAKCIECLNTWKPVLGVS